jgi:glycosyltransferase involved in cell wall biosynthesis
MITGLVSVVVDAYNNWSGMELTIENALHQSYQLAEAVVVDNSSSDATPDEVPRLFSNRGP